MRPDPAQWVIDTPERFSVHRDVFRDPAIFDLEMRHIFERTWVFLGFACQVPKPHDFFTTQIGRTPVIVSRGAKGKLGAWINSCRHRGAVVCHEERGNSRFHVCQYHGWAYDSAGKVVDIKDQAQGCYPPDFAREDHGLKPVARFGEYRGFLFGCLDPDVHSLEEHLGETRTFLDLVVDQGEQGFELVPGSSSYIFNGNWKLQIENCVDLYHLTSTHPSFIQIVERRKSGESGNGLAAIDFTDYRLPGITRGSYTFDHGHAMVWGGTAAPQVRPLWADIERVRERVGPLKAQWMLATRNLTLYPNVQIAENASLQVRVIRPLAVDRTEMRIYCLGPVGEAPAARAHRIRQYEDFFNSTGLATPDDTICYQDCQTGFGARDIDWQQGYERGMTARIDGPDSWAEALGVRPRTSLTGPFDTQDETVFHAGYREWLRLLGRGIERDGQ
jgi:phenylpropionate dioxygenase-like ring-hydroxylating dioxygenase large terminal subunit